MGENIPEEILKSKNSTAGISRPRTVEWTVSYSNTQSKSTASFETKEREKK